MFGIHRVDQGHPAHHLLDLVGLEMADEVDLGPPVGVRGQMGGEFLHPVLPADRNPRGNGLADGVVRLHLCGGAQGNLPRCPAGGLGRGGNFIPNRVYMLLNGHSWFPLSLIVHYLV